MKFFLVTLFALINSVLFAQNSSWDSTYRPGSYSVRVGHFNSYPNHKKDIIFLGNSISLGTEWQELLQHKRVRNRGISGDISFGVIERLREITEGNPRKVFILIGINDIARGIPDDIIVDNYRRIIRQIKIESPRTEIFFQTILPVNNEFKDRHQFNKDDHIHTVNSLLKQLVLIENIHLIDLHPHFLNKENKLDKKYTYDGLHLNADGYKKWASILINGKYLK
ncbi:MAG: sialate O-acetylesterase [Chitinophagaceae bacterium]|jgi:lysophospholipase L1-like esterase|nr:sialate O-acetylesterase [Chitinophagaceae bacterium]